MAKNPLLGAALRVEGELIETIREVRVDRDDEVSYCTEALLNKYENVLLYGERGVGKSFLVRLIHDEIERVAPSVLPITINMSGLAAYSPQDNASAFPRAVLIQLCAELWKKLLGKDYLDLRERLKETGSEITTRSRAEKTIQRIYSNLMVYSRKSRFEWHNSVGFAAGVKGEKREAGIIEQQQADILPFEFLEFISEINTNVLAEYEITRVLILCDEANLLPIFNQHEILERYLELFAAKYVQFMFVAGFVDVGQINNLPTSFEARLELKGLPTIQHAKELINKWTADEITFLEGAIEHVFDCFKGNPRHTLQACSKAISIALSRGRTEVDSLMTRLSCAELKEYFRKVEAEFPRSRGSVTTPSS
jgi:hypothetical protein